MILESLEAWLDLLSSQYWCCVASGLFACDQGVCEWNATLSCHRCSQRWVPKLCLWSVWLTHVSLFLCDITHFARQSPASGHVAFLKRLGFFLSLCSRCTTLCIVKFNTWGDSTALWYEWLSVNSVLHSSWRPHYDGAELCGYVCSMCVCVCVCTVGEREKAR